MCRVRPLLPLVILAVCLAPLPAFAADGVVMVQTITTGSNVARSEVQMSRTHLRTDLVDAAKRQQVIIYDGTKDVLYIIDVAGKSYVEMTRADAERMGAQMQAATAALRQQMAGMSPAQRAAMEQKLGPTMAAVLGGGARPTYKRTGSGQVGRWACETYDGYVGDRKASEVCAADPKVFGLTLDDFAVTAQMTGFVGSMMPELADRLVALGTPAQGFSGLPIRSSSTVGSQPVTVELSEIRRVAIPDDAFQVPDGFRKQAMQGMGR